MDPDQLIKLYVVQYIGNRKKQSERAKNIRWIIKKKKKSESKKFEVGPNES